MTQATLTDGEQLTVAPAALPLDELLPRPAWPSVLRDHLSASSISTFARCPEQFRRRYLQGEKERPAAAMVWGSADHAAHELNFRQKIDTHEDLGEDDVTLAFAEAFDRSVEREGGATEIDWREEKPGAVKDKGVALVGHYHRKVSPSVQPLAVEKNIRHRVSGIPVPVVGRVDVVTEEAVIERKTAARVMREPQPHWLLQGRIYQAATGKPAVWHISTKTKLPAVYTPAQEPGLLLGLDPKMIDATEERVRRIVAVLLHLCATFGPDEPWPSSAPDYGWACGFCGFRPTCAWWGGKGQ